MAKFKIEVEAFQYKGKDIPPHIKKVGKEVRLYDARYEAWLDNIPGKGCWVVIDSLGLATWYTNAEFRKLTGAKK